MGLFKRINKGLKKTRDSMTGAINAALYGKNEIDDDFYEELEEILVMADVGVTTAQEIVEKLRDAVFKKNLRRADDVKAEIRNIVAELLSGGEELDMITVPSVILVIGVNGVGKTTSIGKMAAMFKAEGKKVILGAADTFRAAAIDQLEIWADRAGVDIVKHKEGADPAAVVFDTISAGKARNADIIICDTAGRLHNKKNLMEELAKIYRVIDRELPYSDREVLLVLDATTGQNAVNQAKEFKAVADITGIVLTKLDGTARGGVVLAIKNELGIPVKFIGVGEQIDDLQPFNPAAFADGLFDKIDYTEEEDVSLDKLESEPSAHSDTVSETEEVNEIINDFVETVNEIFEETGIGEETPEETADEEEAVEEEPVIEEETEDSEEQDKKRKKGFFGLFNRNS